MKMIKDTIIKVSLFTLFIFIIWFSQDVVIAAKDALYLCLNRVIPALFPFFVISRLIVSFNLTKYLSSIFSPLFKNVFKMRSDLSTPFVLSLTGGYPVGAATIANLLKEKKCTTSEAIRLLSFSNNTGPSFILGMCGAAIFKSVKVGIILYIVHILSAIITGFIVNLRYNMPVNSKKESNSFTNKNISSEIVAAIKNAFFSCLDIVAFVVFFAVILCILEKSGFFSILTLVFCRLCPFFDASSATALLKGIIELTNGLSIVNSSAPVAPSVCSFILAFGGISVHFQTLSVLSDFNLPMSGYLKGKFIHAITAFLLCFAFMPFLR